MNKALFFSGLGIFVLEVLLGIFVFLNQFSVSSNTANMIVGITVFSSFTILSLVLMILGAIEK